MSKQSGGNKYSWQMQDWLVYGNELCIFSEWHTERPREQMVCVIWKPVARNLSVSAAYIARTPHTNTRTPSAHAHAQQ